MMSLLVLAVAAALVAGTPAVRELGAFILRGTSPLGRPDRADPDEVPPPPGLGSSQGPPARVIQTPTKH